MTGTPLRRRRFLLGSGLCIMALVGCGPSTSAPNEPAVASVVLALEAAEDEGDASPEQLEVLRRALAEGREITEQEYRSAYAIAVDCVRDAGVNVISIDEVYDAGNLQLYMTVNGREEDEDFMFTSMGICEHRHSTYLDLARRLSAKAAATKEALINQYLPAMLACVRSKGARLPDDATYDEIVAQDPDLTSGSDPGKTCISTTGLQDALDSP